MHAGDLIKVGFGLNGDRGLNVWHVHLDPVACPAWTPHTVPAAGAGTTAGLSYGVASGHYTYGWQTSAGWAGTCRRVRRSPLNDGSRAHGHVHVLRARRISRRKPDRGTANGPERGRSSFTVLAFARSVSRRTTTELPRGHDRPAGGSTHSPHLGGGTYESGKTGWLAIAVAAMAALAFGGTAAATTAAKTDAPSHRDRRRRRDGAGLQLRGRDPRARVHPGAGRRPGRRRRHRPDRRSTSSGPRSRRRA